jgi:hypothetical protein
LKNTIIGFLLGAAAAAIIMTLLDDRHEERADSRDHVETPATFTDVPQPAARATARTPTSERATATRPDSSANLADEGSAAVPPTPIRTAKIPGGSPGEDQDTNLPLKRLVEAFRIDCLYGPGYGGNWSNGMPSPHTAAWQGGQITFDTIDVASGTALLKTSSGLTRTENGELEVSVQVTQTGLHFTVFAPGGELIVATVYGILDAQRKNAAVASFHGPHIGNESAQFYGACTSS